LSQPAHRSPRTAPAAAPAPPIRVLLALSSPLERLGWSIVLDGQPDIRVLAQPSDCRATLAFLAANPVDVVLLDDLILAPGDCENLLRFCSPPHAARFLLLSSHPIGHASQDLHFAFASRCLLKGVSAPDLLRAIRALRPARRRK
jgi:DNA-binding NarL/FixJ family response regulator